MRVRRFRRKTLTPRQQAIQESVDQADAWVDVIAHGLGWYVGFADSTENVDAARLILGRLEDAIDQANGERKLLQDAMKSKSKKKKHTRA